ncbi:hypothetical protein GLAREA_12940 [Glarea lozoyensis ATCC 20868]|uniref:Uncharacterized protein n=1 Tax=Glarea lozoyensis (strain ATCC 20868 / MF5171) TaxID=1116229 RepID=S3CUZ3_GLAL2|nr:uncharacterized protein GLAREA_12940 [Glarea lozoyensis ATCC 20868]EPE30217.1 hypothetical protein GLAREA_12940 [Glarea lozoyensis ATCC 20868]
MAEGIRIQCQRSADANTARVAMAHDPASRVLEEYYDDSTLQLGVSAIALGETAVNLVDQSWAILYKFRYTLNALETEKLLTQAVQDDPDFQTAATARDIKRCAKSTRFPARAALRDHCREEHQKNVTVSELRGRVAQLKTSGKVFQELQEKICLNTEAVDETVDVEQPDLDVGKVLGLQFTDEVD